MPDEQTVTSSDKPWSEEVQQADTTPEDKTAYTFSNGRKFVNSDTPYV